MMNLMGILTYVGYTPYKILGKKFFSCTTTLIRFVRKGNCISSCVVCCFCGNLNHTTIHLICIFFEKPKICIGSMHFSSQQYFYFLRLDYVLIGKNIPTSKFLQKLVGNKVFRIIFILHWLISWRFRLDLRSSFDWLRLDFGRIWFPALI